jgi:hypothetical protein
MTARKRPAITAGAAPKAEAIQDFRDYCADAHDARLAKAEAMQRWGDMHDKTIAMVKAAVGIG